MSDRALLEAAARATGYEFGYINDELRLMIPGSCGTWGCTKPHSTKWNPLTDDGDALRLAVKLPMVLDMSTPGKFEVRYWIGDDEMPYAICDEKDYKRAIVRAAAALGSDK